ncbi:MAG: hypothetical protein ACJ739_03910 [Acidimicrobiales bacterium]
MLISVRWRQVVGGTAVGLTLLAACGDDSGEAVVKETVAPYEDSQSLAEWQEQTAAVCETYEPKLEAVRAKHGDPKDAVAFIALLKDLEPVRKEYQQAFRAVPVAAERRHDIERARDLSQLVSETASALLAAANKGDEATRDDAAEALTARTKELTALLDDLGVPACA